MILYIAQAIGFLGLILAAISFQKNTNKGIVLFQNFAASTFVLHFILLGAYTGAVMNLIGVLRGLVFINRKNSWANNTLWLYVFILAFIKAGVATWKNILSMLPMVGMILASVGLWIKNPKLTRKLLLIASPCWMIYSIANGSIAGIATETFAFTSIVIAIVRYDVLKQDEKSIPKEKTVAVE